MQNSDFCTRITSLYWSQTSPVVLCMQNSLISTGNTSLYWSQPSSVVFAGKTATFGPELQVSMGTKPHLSFCACKTAWLAPELLVFVVSSHHLWLCALKRATWGLWIACLYGFPPSHVVFWLQNRVPSIRPTRFCGSQPSSVVFAGKTAAFGPE